MELTSFLRQLDERRASYRIDRWRDATMLNVFVPGEHWEIEFMDAGGVEVERFRATAQSVTSARSMISGLSSSSPSARPDVPGRGPT